MEFSRSPWPRATCTPTEWTSSRLVVQERSTERSSRPWWRGTPRCSKHKIVHIIACLCIYRCILYWTWWRGTHRCGKQKSILQFFIFNPLSVFCFLFISTCLCDFLCIFLCLCIYLFLGVANLRRSSPTSVRRSRGSLHLIAGAENLCFLESIWSFFSWTSQDDY